VLTNLTTVVKSNELVQACYQLTLTEQRVIICALAKVKKGEAADKVTVTAKQMADSFNIDINKAYTQLQEATNRLYERDIRVKGTKGGKWARDGEYTRLRWLQRITVEEGAGSVDLHFNTQLHTYIFELKKNFTKYKQLHVRNLTSVHAMRLYELLVQYLTFKTRTFELQELRELLGIEDKYALWADLKRNVIEKSITQINAHTNIEIYGNNGQYFKLRKQGKKVIGVTFIFGEKEQLSLL